MGTSSNLCATGKHQLVATNLIQLRHRTLPLHRKTQICFHRIMGTSCACRTGHDSCKHPAGWQVPPADRYTLHTLQPLPSTLRYVALDRITLHDIALHCICTYIHTYIHTCMHACMHACMHTDIPTHIQSHTHTRTHNYIALLYITVQYRHGIHYSTLHYTTMHFITVHDTTLTLHGMAWHGMAWHT